MNKNARNGFWPVLVGTLAVQMFTRTKSYSSDFARDEATGGLGA